MINIYGFDLKELVCHLSELGEPPYRASQIFHWLYKSKINSFDKMSNIPKTLREKLKANYIISLPKIITKQISSDGSIKYLLGLNDGYCIETVFMPDIKRDTFCLSSQVGCPFDCKFCITALSGFKRNLTADEIIGQLLVSLPTYSTNKKINIVFMGMGEPLLNIKNVMKAISIMTDKNGLNLSLRNITISTIGFPPGISELLNYNKLPKIALSLHSTNEKVRNFLMPKLSKYTLNNIINSIKKLPMRKGHRITIEYVMINDINDSIEDADNLLKITKKLPAKVNLIPLNEAEQISFKSSSIEKIEKFADYLRKNYCTVTIRKSRGKDISAACGMLKWQQAAEK